MTYPAPPPTVSGQTIAVSYLMGQPKLLQRLLRTLVQQRLVGDKILTGRVDLTGSGAAIFEVSESIFVPQSAEKVDPLMEYPLTTEGLPTLSTVATDKWALATEVSDEAIARNRWDVVMRKLLKLSNRIVFQFDSMVLSAVGSAVTQTRPASAAWDSANADPFLDVLLGGADVDTLNQGYTTNVVLLTPIYFARLLAAAKILDRLPREGADNPILTGRMIQIAGMTFIKTTNMPPGVNVLPIDSQQFGSIAYENLGGGYNGDPADVTGVESKVIRKDENDGFRIQARKVQVPMIQEPNAATKITGA